jgi:exosome complex RNA-binding protein Rrp42 (RNase PH superfamily)
MPKRSRVKGKERRGERRYSHACLHVSPSDPCVGTLQVEVGEPKPSKPDLGVLHVDVECSPCASPDYEGRGGDLWSAELATSLSQSLRPLPNSEGKIQRAGVARMPSHTRHLPSPFACIPDAQPCVVDPSLATSCRVRCQLAVTMHHHRQAVLAPLCGLHGAQ